MNTENLWGPIDAKDFASIKHIKDRFATEKDVAEGYAVFHVKDAQDHSLLNLEIPSLAYQTQETEDKILAVIIQAEMVNGQEIIGLRYIEGGNGICELFDLEFIP